MFFPKTTSRPLKITPNCNCTKTEFSAETTAMKKSRQPNENF